MLLAEIMSSESQSPSPDEAALLKMAKQVKNMNDVPEDSDDEDCDPDFSLEDIHPADLTVCKRRTRYSQATVHLLVEKIAQFKEILRSRDHTPKMSELKTRVWEEISQEVSAVDSEIRGPIELRKKWFDLRRYALKRKFQRAAGKYSSATRKKPIDVLVLKILQSTEEDWVESGDENAYISNLRNVSSSGKRQSVGGTWHGPCKHHCKDNGEGREKPDVAILRRKMNSDIDDSDHDNENDDDDNSCDSQALNNESCLEKTLRNSEVVKLHKEQLRVEKRRLKIEERRLVIEEKRLAIEEKRFALEEKRAQKLDSIESLKIVKI